MSKQFNIGDDVIVVNDADSWLDSEEERYSRILKIVDSNKHGYRTNLRANQITIDNVVKYPEDFQVVSKSKENVEIEVMIGDYVEVLVPLQGFAKEQTIEVGTVLEVVEDKPSSWWVHGDTIALGALVNHRSKFKLVPAPVGEQCPETIIPMTRIEKEETVRAEDIGQFIEDRVKEIIKPELGVYRPQLETRKVGKVRVELVDKGFPNTLWALAELLTWAQETKGYKDHDWANLPNAIEELPAAASRHRVKHNKGMLYDEESGKLHKLHELFGVIAECELLLKGEDAEQLTSRIKQMCSSKSK